MIAPNKQLLNRLVLLTMGFIRNNVVLVLKKDNSKVKIKTCKTYECIHSLKISNTLRVTYFIKSMKTFLPLFLTLITVLNL